MSPLQLLLIAAIGFLGSFYGVVSGGGGLIIIPRLILAGLSAPSAVASSRLGMLGLSLTGAWRYREAGLLRARSNLPLIWVVAPGSALGALLLLVVDAEVLARLIGLLTIAAAVIIFFGRQLGLERESAPACW
jgi:uncharacterized protein